MNAMIPLNIAALRVNANDQSSIVGQFKGRTARFEKLPYRKGDPTASTGDTIAQALDDPSSPADPLSAGIHLHWQLPDYFRRGVQQPGGGPVVFPHAPNRWLVIRYLSVFTNGAYGPVTTKRFIVESDYLSATIGPDPDGVFRPAIPVPLRQSPALRTQPFLYMGRVLNYENWNPAGEQAQDFLPYNTGADGNPLYLTSIGFVGPAFAAFYPECRSVFGFWDHFRDIPAIATAIAGNTQLQFKVSYQIAGWINEAATDPLAGIGARVTSEYNRYVAQCAQQKVPVTRTPSQVFESISEHDFRWSFHPSGITYTLNGDNTLNTIAAPGASICSGIMQEIVWNMLTDSYGYFLNNPEIPPAQQPCSLWSDTVKVAVGNTTEEALAALLKNDMPNPGGSASVARNYEYLLDSLQSGMLNGLKSQDNKLASMDESLHSKAFSKTDGGLLWIIEKQADLSGEPTPESEITLPLPVAEQLSRVNQAQKNYDQGRAALATARQQLFMDWMRWVKLYVANQQMDHPNGPSTNQMGAFLSSSGSCEIQSVVDAGTNAGILSYQVDPQTKRVVAIQQPTSAANSLAAQGWTQYQALVALLQAHPEWLLEAVPAPPFYLPTDPVVLMEGKRMEPANRNGLEKLLPVRLSGEILSTLWLQFSGATFTVPASSLAGMPAIGAPTTYQPDLQALVGEAGLLIPSLAPLVTAALQAQGGANNPATANATAFAASLQSAQGGLSALAGGPGAGLFAAVHAANYQPSANPSQAVTSPQAISFQFTNATSNGWAPHPIAWSAQENIPEFSATRNDPFLPVFVVWKTQLWPLQWDNGQNYTPDNVTRSFVLNPAAVDYQYQMTAPFAAADFTVYDNWVVLSSKSSYSLNSQIESYRQLHATAAASDALKTVQTNQANRKILSQALSGFNVEQTLRAYVPQITVEDLLLPQDAITPALVKAATKIVPADNWYSSAFNSVMPVATGPLALSNFGPLRAGFMEITQLLIVDVFGQRMKVNTAVMNPDNSLQTSVALSMQPLSGDAANQSKIFLPPRLLTPARLWFRWLSAVHDNNPGSSDFVEMNTHPATSPVCGWVVPNHLDNSLFFYDANGAAIGSFGIEHGVLTYRTRAGNLANPSSDLGTDIGLKGAANPLVNDHVATLMWNIAGRPPGFLSDLMFAILNSDMFINPANFAQDANLAVFIGRPLAITRALMSLETKGGVLPLSQADTSTTDPFAQDVINNRFAYASRQPVSSANLGNVQFPVRLGNLPHLDDGLVGYFIEQPTGDPYATFYSAAAAAGGGNGVEQPASTNIQLTLNSAPILLTMLVDPRADVHATTGVLPVAELDIPPEQYSQAMSQLAVTFFTNPVLRKSHELLVPLPHEAGYAWSWITAGAAGATALKENASNDFAVYSYSPQSLLEGWLRLLAAPPKPQA